jgi:hypothetical protein
MEQVDIAQVHAAVMEVVLATKVTQVVQNRITMVIEAEVVLADTSQV